MHTKKSDISAYTRPGILAADQPLVVPMLLRISDVKLRGIIVLVVSKQKGITLVFKNDPLEKILVSSTFDSVSSVRNFLQAEIEKQLRTMFQEDMPTMIHNLSIQWVNGEQVKQKRQQEEEALKLRNNRTKITPPASVHEGQHLAYSSPYPSRILNGLRNSGNFDTMSMPELTGHQQTAAHPVDGFYAGVHPDTYSDDGIPDYFSDGYPYDHARLENARLENATGGFSTFSDLYNRERGLKKLVERADFERSMYTSLEGESKDDWRRSAGPMLALPIGSGEWQRKPSSTPTTAAQSDVGDRRTFVSPRNSPPVLPTRPAPVTAENLDHHNRHLNHRSRTYDSYDRYSDASSNGSRERYFSSPRGPSRQNSASSSVIFDDHDAAGFSGFGNDEELRDGVPDTLLLPQDQEIVLQPSRNAMAAQLAQLMNSNQTISPYTPMVEHCTSRSKPHQPKNGAAASAGKKKVAKRKVIRLSSGLGSIAGSSASTSEPSSETKRADDRGFVSWDRRPVPSISSSSVTTSLSSPHYRRATTAVPPKHPQRSMSDSAPVPVASVSTPLRVLSPRPVPAHRARQHPVLVTDEDELVASRFGEEEGERSDDDSAVVTPPAIMSPEPEMRGAEYYNSENEAAATGANIGNGAKSVRVNGSTNSSSDTTTFRLMGLGVMGRLPGLSLV